MPLAWFLWLDPIMATLVVTLVVFPPVSLLVSTQGPALGISLRSSTKPTSHGNSGHLNSDYVIKSGREFLRWPYLLHPNAWTLFL